MADFLMPSLGADMEAGTLVEWLVEPGQTVHRGDVVAVVETQKGAIEIEVFEDGVVGELLVHPGTRVPVGTPLARIVGEGGSAAPSPSPPSTPRAEATAEREAPAAPATERRPTLPPPSTPAPPTGGRLRVSPAARRLAEQRNVDLSALTGTGPGGAISLADVERSTGGPAPAASGAAPDRTSEMRRAIAAAMSRANREIPHYYLTETIDLHAGMAWLRDANEKRPVQRRLLPAALLLRAVALALAKVPEFNGYWIDGGFKAGDGIHLGVAIALRGGGLIAPAIHDVDRLSVDEVQAKLLDLVKRTRSGGLRGSELTDATVTVTSLGELGADAVLGVIYPPQVALIGFGRIEDRPWAIDGALAVRPLVTTSLSADHRASDGQRGSRLLAEIDTLLQTPEAL